ncbi:MAG: malonyl-ACP O-methyltransferase BioC [Mariprofundaceae bacterium]
MVREHINSHGVQRAFSGAVNSYDAHARLQREIGERLLAHLNFTKLAPKRILDIGCGTGYFTRLLQQKFKKAEITAIDLSTPMVASARRDQKRRMPWHGKQNFATADCCALPFSTGSFDLVTSNLVMQWVVDPPLMMQEMRRVLAVNGLILFSTFGRRTLVELRQTLAQISQEQTGRVLPFPDVMSLGNHLMQLAVETPVTDSDLFTLTYPNTMALVRELKGMGASAGAIRGRSGGLYGRKLLRELDELYSIHHLDDEGRIRATFEALYAQAWYKEPGFADREQVIPIQTA